MRVESHYRAGRIAGGDLTMINADDRDLFWTHVVPFFGLDESFQYTDAQIAYYLDLYAREA